MAQIPFGGEVFPRRISLRNEPFLLRSIPALQLLLAVDRFVRIVERLVIDQPMTLVLPSKSFNQIVLMFPDPAMQIVRHTDIENAGAARDHVNAVPMLFHALPPNCHPAWRDPLFAGSTGAADEQQVPVRPPTCGRSLRAGSPLRAGMTKYLKLRICRVSHVLIDVSKGTADCTKDLEIKS
jgi:hypothetical protein